jgi:hypothetical protein
MSIHPFTPAELRDLYATLARDDRDTFLKLIAEFCTGREPLLLASELPIHQQYEFSSRTTAVIVTHMLPLLVHHAVRIVREKPHLDDEALKKELEANVKEWVEGIARDRQSLERDRLKKERDPKPRKTDRDDEIVRLRDKEGKTFGEIGRALVRANPKWCRKDGSPLTREAVEKAYHRRKGMPTN